MFCITVNPETNEIIDKNQLNEAINLIYIQNYYQYIDNKFTENIIKKPGPNVWLYRKCKQCNFCNHCCFCNRII